MHLLEQHLPYEAAEAWIQDGIWGWAECLSPGRAQTQHCMPPLPWLPASRHTTDHSTRSFWSQPGDMCGINEMTISTCLMQFLLTGIDHCVCQLNSQGNQINSRDLEKGPFAFAIRVRACRAASWTCMYIYSWALALVHHRGSRGRVRPQGAQGSPSKTLGPDD